MQLTGTVPERLVLNDRSAERSAELIANQSVLVTREVGEPVVRSECLNTVVFEGRSMPLVGAALKDCICDKTAALAVFGRVAVGNNTIFLNGLGRDASRSAALVIGRNLTTASLALFIVVGTFDQIAA